MFPQRRHGRPVEPGKAIPAADSRAD